MKQPTRKDTVTFRVWKQNGAELVENIVGLIEYPLVIHRNIVDHTEIIEGTRKRYGGYWNVTHIPTGKSFGIRSKDWDKVVSYVTQVKDHPALLMVTDDTMTNHPMFEDLSDLHSRVRRELF